MHDFIKKSTAVATIAIVAILAYGCYPGGPEYQSDQNIVYTSHDSTYDFGSKSTYYLPDTVVFRTNIQNAAMRSADARKLLEEIESAMDARGYVQVDTSASAPPDLLVVAEVTALRQSGYSYIPGSFSPFYGSGWGWGGGGWAYPTGYIVPYNVTTGTAYVSISDPNAAQTVVSGNEAAEAIPIVWVGVFNGLFSGANGDAGRIEYAVSQSFAQSPYLQSN